MSLRGGWVSSSAFLHLSADENEAGGLVWGFQTQATCVFELILLTFPFLLHLPLPHFLFLFLLSLFVLFLHSYLYPCVLKFLVSWRIPPSTCVKVLAVLSFVS